MAKFPCASVAVSRVSADGESNSTLAPLMGKPPESTTVPCSVWVSCAAAPAAVAAAVAAATITSAEKPQPAAQPSPSTRNRFPSAARHGVGSAPHPHFRDGRFCASISSKTSLAIRNASTAAGIPA